MTRTLPKIRTGLEWGLRTIVFFFLAAVLAAQQDPALERARQALATGDMTQAIPLLENYRKAHASNPEIYELLGIAYGRAGDNDQSLGMFKEFARLAPRSP